MKYFLAVLLFSSFFIINLFNLKDYGINWDEPNHYFRAQSYLRFMLTGKHNYSDLSKLAFHYQKNIFFPQAKRVSYADDKYFRRSIYQYDQENGPSSFDIYKDSIPSHPPINGILASLSNDILYQKLGVMGDIESYHIFIVFVSSLLVAGVFLFTSGLYGKTAGLVAALALGTYPLFFGESHNNIKDPVEAAFFTLCLYSFYKAFVTEKWSWIIASSIFAGLALGTKFNILFTPFIVLPWIVLYAWNKKKGIMSFFSKKKLFICLTIPAIAFLMLYISWPYLWYHPFGITNVFKYYEDIGGISYQTSKDIVLGSINLYTPKWIIYITPLVTLFLSAFGILYTLINGRKEKTKLSFLILFWLIISIGRVMIPTMGIYGGVRQIMEYIPALAIMAGIGWYWLENVLKKLTKSLFSNSTKGKIYRVIPPLVALLIFVPIMLRIIALHPNESVYFNPLIGGLNGAREKNFTDWGITLGNQYQQGINWLNVHAEPNANVGLVKGLIPNVPRIKIRPDINFSEFYYSGPKKEGEYLMEVIDYQWYLDASEKKDYLQTLMPVYDIKVDGVSILYIWKNDKAHAKSSVVS